MNKRQKRINIWIISKFVVDDKGSPDKCVGIFDRGSRCLKISNTRLPKLYFADAANLSLQYNLKRIEPLSPRGMRGQDEQGSMKFRGEEEGYPELAGGDPHAGLVPL